MEELKPCPFCGAQFFDGGDGIKKIVHKSECYFVQIGIGNGWVVQPKNEWFFKNWNTRKDPAYLAGYKDGKAIADSVTAERTCDGCVNQTLNESGNWCGDCSRKYADLYVKEV